MAEANGQAYLLCATGATMGSCASVVQVGDSPRMAIVRGLGIMPLELPTEIFGWRAEDLVDRALNEFDRLVGSRPKTSTLVFGLSSHISEDEGRRLWAAVSNCEPGMTPQATKHWIPRALACTFANLQLIDTIVIKTGTVGFAHGFIIRQTGVVEADWRVGGWGTLSGNDGGGYQIGRHMLFRQFQELDHRVDETDFRQKFQNCIPAARSIETLAKWIRTMSMAGQQRVEVSRLAETAILLAEKQGVGYCRDLLKQAAGTVADSARVVARTLKRMDDSFGQNGLQVILHGGLFQHSLLYARALLSEVGRRLDEEGFNSYFLDPLRIRPLVGCILYGLIHGLHYPIEAARQVANSLVSDYSTALRCDFEYELDQLGADGGGEDD